MNQTNAIINYTLHKFCPLFVVAFLLFMNFEFNSWEPYIILCMFFFSQNFHYKAGYSMAFCEKHDLL